MHHLRKEMQGILDQAVAICADFDEELAVIKERQKIEAALAKYQPTLTFYGLYNAGKSTLINALLSKDGSEIAPTAARPCTDRIRVYQLGDYQVFDTPGLDAPEVHEHMSRLHVEESNIIVFVVSTGGTIDEEATIRELVELWQSGRPVIVVLNDKSAGVEGRRSPAVAGMRKQLFDHLEIMAGDTRIRDEIDFVLVNAKTALKGRGRMASAGGDEKARKSGELLYEMSGVPELASLMMTRLMESGEEKILLPAKNMLEDALKESARQLEDRVSGDGEAAFYRAMQRMVKSVERDFLESAKLGIQLLRKSLTDDFLVGLRAGEGIDLQVFVESYEEDVETLLEQYAQEGYQRIEEHFIELDEALKRDIEIGLARVEAFLGEGAAMLGLEGSSSSFRQMSPQERRLLAQKMSEFFQSPSGQKMLTKGLKYLRQAGVPGIKGRWSMTLNRWAGNIGRGLGIGIQVFAAGYEVYAAVKAQKAYEEEVRRREQDLVNTSENLAKDVERQIMAELPRVSIDIFGGIREHFAGFQKDLGQEKEQVQQALRELEHLVERLDRLAIQAFQ